MKLLPLIGLMIFAISANSQTPEQKKQMEEAIRKQDSIMNLPQIKEAMARAEAMKIQMEKDMKEMAPPATPPKNAVKPQTNPKAVNEFYWYNTIESDSEYVFENWSYGATEIRGGFYDRRIKGYVHVPMGKITSKGRVILDLPAVDPAKVPWKPITVNYSEGENIMHKTLEYSDSDAQWISTRFSLGVWQNDRPVGYLKMGDHIKPVVNLNSPCCTYKAGDGYAVSWVFMDRPNSVVGDKTNNNGGKEDYDLQFSRGWNLIKIRVAGTQYQENSNIAEWTHKYHTVIPNMPMGVKFYFTSQ